MVMNIRPHSDIPEYCSFDDRTNGRHTTAIKTNPKFVRTFPFHITN
jgi:hypothetical protein